MSGAGRKCSADAYWKYLEDNSKTVSTWPEWLRGEGRSVPSEQVREPQVAPTLDNRGADNDRK